MICNNCNREIGVAPVWPFCNTITFKESLPHHLPAGTVIGGKYVIKGVLGEGGFGITYLGWHSFLDRYVAVKEYFPHGFSYRNTAGSYDVYISAGSNRDFYEHGKTRFLDEAKTLVRFSNEPGVVAAMDFVEENNTAYLIMEYLEGVTLQQYLKQHGTMSAKEAFTLLTPVMQTLEKIHEAGVIHRDISPDNIMRLKDGCVKLMDFGAAKEYIDENRSMSVMLKKGYAPEEQYRRNGRQGPWTDVYALCATIYRCITGRAPDESLDRREEDTLQKPSLLGADISPAEEQVLLYGMAVRRTDRCQSMTELIELLRQAELSPSFLPVPAASSDDATVYAEQDYPSDPGQERPNSDPFYSPNDRQTDRIKRKDKKVGVICAIVLLLVTSIVSVVIILYTRNPKPSVDSVTASSISSQSEPGAASVTSTDRYQTDETSAPSSQSDTASSSTAGEIIADSGTVSTDVRNNMKPLAEYINASRTDLIVDFGVKYKSVDLPESGLTDFISFDSAPNLLFGLSPKTNRVIYVLFKPGEESYQIKDNIHSNMTISDLQTLNSGSYEITEHKQDDEESLLEVGYYIYLKKDDGLCIDFFWYGEDYAERTADEVSIHHTDYVE